MGLFDQFPYTNIHELNLDWVLSKLKQHGIILDSLDQLIADEVKDQLDNLNLSEIIINILSQYGAVINVKDPGHELTAATGDGVTDDTEALQAIIAYAEQNDLPLLFYNGTFMAKSLNIIDCSFIGTDAQLMKIGNTPDPLIYCTGRFTAYGLRINGNLTGQSDPEPTIQMNGASEVSLLDCEIDGGSSCIVGDVSACLKIQNCSLNQYTEYAVDVEGTGFLQCNGCKTDNIASGGALRFMRIGTNNSVVADFISMASVQIGFEFTGDFNTVSARIPNTENHVNDGGQNNSYFFFGNEEKKVLNGDSVETVEGMKTETVGGTKTENYENRQETVTGDVTENYGDHNETSTHTHITASDDIDLTANDVIINPTNPVTYRTPQDLNSSFKYVPFKDYDGNTYKVLVEGNYLSSQTFVNAADFGVVGDGVTDNADAFTSFFNYISANNRIGFIPNGVYYNSRTIGLTGTTGNEIISFFGESKGGVVFKRAPGSGSSALQFMNCVINYMGNFSIDCQGTANQTNGHGINFRDVNTSDIDTGVIENIKIYNVAYSGIQAYVSDADSIHNNGLHFRGITILGLGKHFNTDGVHPTGFILENVNWTTVSDSIVTGICRYAFEFKDYCRFCSMYNCVAYNCVQGFALGGSAASLKNYFCTQISFSNIKTYYTDYGIYAGSANGITVDNFQFVANSDSVYAINTIDTFDFNASNLIISLAKSTQTALVTRDSRRIILNGLNFVDLSNSAKLYASTGTKDREIEIVIVGTNRTSIPDTLPATNSSLAILPLAIWKGATWQQNPT